MGDMLSAEELTNLLVQYLAAHPGSSAKKVAKDLDEEKSRINAILHREGSLFTHVGDLPPLWSVATLDGTVDSQHPVSLAGARLASSKNPMGASLSEAVAPSEAAIEILLHSDVSREGALSLAQADELHKAGRLQEALDQYQLASRLLLGRGGGVKNVDGRHDLSRVEVQSSIPGSPDNGLNMGTTKRGGLSESKPVIPSAPKSVLQDEIEDLVREYPGVSYGELATLIGGSENEIRQEAKKVRYLIIDDQEDEDVDDLAVIERNRALLDVIRDAGTMEFPLSSDGYDELLRKGFIRGVTSVRIGQIFGSWRRACEVAGVEAPKAARSNYESKWTDQELAEAVARFLTANQYGGAHHRYDDWRRDTGSDDDTPSSGTLRNRLGPSWKMVRRRGLDILRERWLLAEEQWLGDQEVEWGLG